MKIQSTTKHFHLSLENVNKLLNKYIRPEFPDVEISAKESLSTNSIYVLLTKNGLTREVRLSDHPTNKNLVYHYISKRTKERKVVGIFINNIRILNEKLLSKTLEELTKKGDENGRQK